MRAYTHNYKMLKSFSKLLFTKQTFAFNRLISSNVPFSFKVNKFNDIHIKSNDLINFYEKINSNSEQFDSTLKDSLEKWQTEKRTAVWIYLPIHLSHLASISAKYGFKYHHAENDEAVVCKWLPTDKESKIPLFATHQMGVAGCVFRSDTNQVLAIKERVMIKDAWKFPGGAANLAEDISQTAVREVFEETGIKTKFCSVIGFRQQHNYPNGFGRSDLYVVCRLEPLNYEINACKDEVRDCQWIDIDKMLTFKENNLTQHISRLIKHGQEKGFDTIDIKPKYMESIMPGRFYNFFHRKI